MDSIGLIRGFLDDRLGVPATQVVPDASLAELGVDSLMLLELMFEFEDRYGIKLAADTKPPRTVGALAGLMDELMRRQKG